MSSSYRAWWKNFIENQFDDGYGKIYFDDFFLRDFQREDDRAPSLSESELSGWEKLSRLINSNGQSPFNISLPQRRDDILLLIE